MTFATDTAHVCSARCVFTGKWPVVTCTRSGQVHRCGRECQRRKPTLEGEVGDLPRCARTATVLTPHPRYANSPVLSSGKSKACTMPPSPRPRSAYGPSQPRTSQHGGSKRPPSSTIPGRPTSATYHDSPARFAAAMPDPMFLGDPHHLQLERAARGVQPRKGARSGRVPSAGQGKGRMHLLRTGQNCVRCQRAPPPRPATAV